MTAQTKLKVLVKVNELGLGGTQLNAIDFAWAARAHGVESIVVGYRETLPASGPSLLDIAAERGVPIEVLDQGPRGGYRDRRRRARELAAVADRHRVDLVHAYGAWSARQAYWGPCRFARRPLVITVYEMYLPSSVYRKPQLVVGTTYMLEDHEQSRGNVVLISPPVDLERDAPGRSAGAVVPEALTACDGLTKVIIVSRLDDEMKAHGVGVAIRAMGALDRDDVVLIVVGGGSAEARLREEGAAINDRLGRTAVIFAGAMGDPRPAYDRADVMLGMGGSAARTLAFAKPLVVIGEHGWCDGFSPETAAMLYRLSFWSDEVVVDAEARLVDTIEPLLDDPEERARLGAFGRQFAESTFGLEAMTARLVATYERAVASYGRSDWIADWGTEISQIGHQIGWRFRRGR